MYEIFEQLMLENHETPYKVAKLTGITQATLSRWKAGKVSPSIETLQTLAGHYKVSVDYLLGKTSFRNASDLYEFWGSNNPEFQAAFDFGIFIKEKRKEQHISLKEMSVALGITESDLDDCEQGFLPLNLDWAEKMANYLGTNVSQILFEHGLYNARVPEEHHNDVRAWEKLVQATEEEAASNFYEHRKSSGNIPEPNNITPVSNVNQKAPEMSPEGKYKNIISKLDELEPEQIVKVEGYIDYMIIENKRSTPKLVAAPTGKTVDFDPTKDIGILPDKNSPIP